MKNISPLSKKYLEAFDMLIDEGHFKNKTECAKKLSTYTHIIADIRNGEREPSKANIENLIEFGEKFGITRGFLYSNKDIEDYPLNIYYVPTNIHAGYENNDLSQRVQANELERFRMPIELHIEGELYAFKVKGDSMEPNFYDKDIVICRQIEKVLDIVDNYVYVLLFENEFVLKRLKKKYFQQNLVGIHLLSDNEQHKNRIIEKRYLEGLRGAIFRVIKRVTISDI